MRCLFGLAILAALISSGCGEDPFATGPTRSAAPEALGISVDTVETAGKPVASQEAAKTQEAPKPQPQAQPEPKPQPQPRLVRWPRRGPVARATTEPASRRRRCPSISAQERIVFDQATHALNLYKASNGRAAQESRGVHEPGDQGQYDQSAHAPWRRVLYDPQKEELFVLKKQ